jgi:membrane associated rhomboid family serine protease
MTKSRITKTGWVVWLYIILFAIMLVLQAQLTFPLPLEGATIALFAVVGAYVGFDQFSSVVTTRAMPRGKKYVESYPKLLAIVIAMFVLLILAIIIQGLVPDYEVPLDTLAMASGFAAAEFAGGNKANNAFMSYGDDPGEEV